MNKATNGNSTIQRCQPFEMSIEEAKKSKSIVISIDFGTSRSGFAYLKPTDAQKKIYNCQEWEESPTRYCKTVTQILYDQQQKAIAWGFPAISQFQNMSDEDAVKHSLLRRFKMELFSNLTGGESSLRKMERNSKWSR